MVSIRAMELQTTKEILAEVFHARPGEVEEMIQRRLEERSRPEGREEGRWTATFSLGDCSRMKIRKHKEGREMYR